mmetsp:Transcript_2118/g.3678  ORF Transcript_2118/g.3678 Transcript_2118/m.3678 type:complete len:510 (-) Transcript_2118:225-1754(-)
MRISQKLRHKSGPFVVVETPRQGATTPGQPETPKDDVSTESSYRKTTEGGEVSTFKVNTPSDTVNTRETSSEGAPPGVGGTPSEGFKSASNDSPPAVDSAGSSCALARRGTDTLDVLTQIDPEKIKNIAKLKVEVRVRSDLTHTQQQPVADVSHPWPLRQRPHHVEGATWRPQLLGPSAYVHLPIKPDQNSEESNRKSKEGPRPVFLSLAESREAVSMGNTAAKSGSGTGANIPHRTAASSSGWAYTPATPQHMQGGEHVHGGSYNSPAGTPSSPLQYAPQTALLPLGTADVSPGGTPRSDSVTKRSPSAFTAEPAEPNRLAIVITWTGGGSSVELQGSFDNWHSRQPMQLTHEGHQLMKLLTPGVYQYKFIVDGEWKYAADQPAIMDEMGNVNNVVEVHEYEPDLPGNVTGFDGLPSPPGSYTCPSLEREDFQKDPPLQPPHLQLTLLNLPAAQEWPSCLPRPQHVVLNHFYSQRAQKVHACVMGTTTRYKSKYITTVLYKPVHPTPA